MADIWYGNPIAVSCNSTVIKTVTAVMAAQLAKAVYTALVSVFTYIMKMYLFLILWRINYLEIGF